MLAFGVIFALTLLSYAMLFNHSNPDDIMSANKANRNPRFRNAAHGRDHHDELEADIAREEQKAIDYWEDFITKNNFVSIGEIYDNCGKFNL